MRAIDLLQSSAKIHRAWAESVADGVPADPKGRTKEPSDYNEHHADISASAKLQDELNRSLQDLVERYRSTPG